MAIEKSTVEKNLSNNQDVDQWEKKIDKELQKSYGVNGKFMRMSVPLNMSAATLAEIIRRYKEVGWDVKHETDFRSSSAMLTFT